MGCNQSKIAKAIEQNGEYLRKNGEYLRKNGEYLRKPAAVVSGDYYDTMGKLWEFVLADCKGDFHDDFQRGECLEYVVPIFKARLQGDLASRYVVPLDSEDSPTPTIKNGDGDVLGKLPFLQKSSSSTLGSGSFTSEHSRGSKRSKNSERSVTGKTNQPTNGHLFGGETKPSTAHLFPPKSPVCQEFYTNMLKAVCGPYEELKTFQEAKVLIGEHEAQMVLVRAIAVSVQNKIEVPISHAAFMDDEMQEGMLVMIPILTKGQALGWNKDEPYSVMIVADSRKTYRFCDMDPRKLPEVADELDIEIATQLATECIQVLGHSLARDDNHALDGTDAGNRLKESGKWESLQSKAAAMNKLKGLIQDNGVMIPILKKGHDKLKLLKINLGDLPHFRAPHPIALAMKAGTCIHKHAAKTHFDLYKSEKLDVQAYAAEKNSMMLLPACEPVEELAVKEDWKWEGPASVADWEWDNSEEVSLASIDSPLDSIPEPAFPSTPPHEITVVSIVTPEVP